MYTITAVFFSSIIRKILNSASDMHHHNDLARVFLATSLRASKWHQCLLFSEVYHTSADYAVAGLTLKALAVR